MILSDLTRWALAQIILRASPGPSFALLPVPMSVVKAAAADTFTFGEGRYRARHANRPTPPRAQRLAFAR